MTDFEEIVTELHGAAEAPSVGGPPAHGATGPGSCAGNSTFRFGSARVDITAPWAGRVKSAVEYPTDILLGLNQRSFARAFVLGDDCSGKEVVLVNTDLSFLFRSVRDGVLAKLRAEPETAGLDPEGILMSATHTHNFSGGHSHDLLYSVAHLGHKGDALRIYVDGIARSIALAHARYRAAQPGSLNLAVNELLGVGENRGLEAYGRNPAEERDRYLDVRGDEVTTNRWVTQVNLVDAGGSLAGILNWFAVHPTTTLPSDWASGDDKGRAAYLFERLYAEAPRADGGPLVAGFFQSDEGDVVPRRHWDGVSDVADPDAWRRLLPDLLGPDLPLELQNHVLLSTQELANAVRLGATEDQVRIHGGVDHRLEYVDMSRISVTDPSVLDGLRHPPELDASRVRTCSPALGLPFITALPGGGRMCSDLPGLGEILDHAATGEDLELLLDVYSYLGCDLQEPGSLLDRFWPGEHDFRCQAEKVILVPTGEVGPFFAPDRLPLQIVRIGNLALVGLPWEVTTMAGRRLRETVYAELRDDGVDQVVIAGLANDYVQYLTTREEYGVQNYEGGSNHFGPWSLAALQQELRRLARDLVTGAPVRVAPPSPEPGPDLPNFSPAHVLWGIDRPTRGPFGSIVDDVDPTYAPGDTVVLRFQGGHPSHDPYLGSSHFEVQRLGEDGRWRTEWTDADPETVLAWEPDTPYPQLEPVTDSLMTVRWFTGLDTPPGRYRVRVRTMARSAPLRPPAEHEGMSGEFLVTGAPAECAYVGPMPRSRGRKPAHRRDDKAGAPATASLLQSRGAPGRPM